MTTPARKDTSKPRTLALIAGLSLLWVLGPAGPANAATITVDTLDDNFSDGGDCSIREAVWAANNDTARDNCPAGSGPDVISLLSGTYLLTRGDFFFEDDPGTPACGDLDIGVVEDGSSGCFPDETEMLRAARPAEGGGESFERSAQQQPLPADLTIDGNGAVIDASGLEHCCGIPAPDRIFHIHGVGVVINNITLQGGGGAFDVTGDEDGPEPVQEGGAILVGEPGSADPVVSGSLILNSSVVRDNAAIFGGGIYNNFGHVELHDSLVGGSLEGENNDPNIATDEGGGIYTAGPSDTGGAGTLIVDATNITGNVSQAHGGGIYNEGDRVEIINNSLVEENVAGLPCLQEEGTGGGNGGGIWTDAAAIFDGDVAAPESPGLFIDNSKIALNRALSCGEEEPSGGNGGGIYNVFGHVETTGGSVIGVENSATFEGGGIWTSGGDTLRVTETTVRGNHAGTDGGGIYGSFDDVVVDKSAISGNTAHNGYGGGVYTGGAGETLTVTNSTISNNDARSTGGVIVVVGSGLGGGLYSGNGGQFLLDSVTMRGNEAEQAGGNIGTGLQVSTSGSIHNSIIAKGHPQNCALDPGDDILSLGFNLSDESTDSCGLEAGSDILGQEAHLGPLQSNGGPTRTHELQAASPAVDSGDPNGCPATDQRGRPRPADGNNDGVEGCDRGSYERRVTAGGPAAGAPGPGPGPGGPPDPDSPCTITGTPGDDTLVGTPGADVFCALGGNDQIIGDPSSAGRTSGSTVAAAGGSDLVRAGPGKDRIAAGPGSDLVIAAKGRDRVRGGPGKDRLNGGKGKDTLRGAGGKDTLRGGKGSDLLNGGKGKDACKPGRGADKPLKRC
jgi:CSLREA domain-containing protein